jgi:hypothetical protein
VTLRESEPHHGGRVRRVELEPGGTRLSSPAQISVQVTDANVTVKIHDGGDDDLLTVEIEDANHHRFKTSVTELGAVEVEIERGRVCSPACASGEECEDGVCQASNERAEARGCASVCDAGQECDDGLCKAHEEAEQDRRGRGGPG